MAKSLQAASTLTRKDTKLIRVNNTSRERIRNLPKFPKSISDVLE